MQGSAGAGRVGAVERVGEVWGSLSKYDPSACVHLKKHSESRSLALLTVPYGVLADRYGRRIILFLGLLGLLMGECFGFIVCR